MVLVKTPVPGAPTTEFFPSIKRRIGGFGGFASLSSQLPMGKIHADGR
jgi:hypothetical protein